MARSRFLPQLVANSLATKTLSGAAQRQPPCESLGFHPFLVQVYHVHPMATFPSHARAYVRWVSRVDYTCVLKKQKHTNKETD